MAIPEGALHPESDPQHPASPAFWRRELGEQLDAINFNGNGKQTDRKLDKQAAFLAALVRNAGVTLACGIAETSIGAYRRWRDEDPIFAACLPMAHEAAGDTIVYEARRRGVDGEEVTVRDRHGDIIAVDRKRDTRLLIELLRGLDFHKRFSKVGANESANKDDWRKGLAEKMDNPEALALIEQLADLAYGEKPKNP